MHPTAPDLCSHCNMLLKYVRYLLQEHQVLIGVTACESRQQHLQTARLWHICRNEGNAHVSRNVQAFGKEELGAGGRLGKLPTSFLPLLLLCYFWTTGRSDLGGGGVCRCGAGLLLQAPTRRCAATLAHVRHLIVPQPSLPDCSFAFV